MNEVLVAGEPIVAQTPKTYKKEEKEEKFEISRADFELLSHIKQTYKDNFHRRKTINFGNAPRFYADLNFYGSVTGCGLMIMIGNSNLSSYLAYVNEKSLAVYKETIADLKVNGVGAILCTIGDTGKTKEHDSLMKMLGFTLLKSYINWRHGPEHKQYLYIKILK